MTMQTARWLACDNPAGCDNQSGDGSLGDSAAWFVRRVAKDDGWHRSASGDICPACWAKGVR